MIVRNLTVYHVMSRTALADYALEMASVIPHDARPATLLFSNDSEEETMGRNGVKSALDSPS